MRRSLPTNSDRPRLSDPELEARLNAIERDSAARYAASEDISDRLDTITRAIDAGPDGDGIITVELDGDDSTVHHAEEVRRVAPRTR